MTFRDHLTVLRRRWPFLVVGTALGLGVAALVTEATPPTYSATTQLFVSARAQDNITELQLGGAFAQARVQSYADLVATPTVLGPVAQKFGIPDEGSLEHRVTASVAANTVLIDISVTDGSASRAARLANAVATSFAAAVDDIERPDSGSASLVRVSTVRTAQTPARPVSPVPAQNLTLGGVAGFLIGALGLALAEALDTRVRGPRMLARLTGVPVLARVPRSRRAARRPADREPGPWTESFRRLGSVLQSDPRGLPRSVLVAAPAPGEGATTVATGLALALAEAGRHTLLVESDLGRAALADAAGLTAGPGLVSVLADPATLGQACRRWAGTGLDVLAAGPAQADSSGWFARPGFGELLRRAEAEYDCVVVAARAVLAAHDATEIARHTSATLLVVHAAKARRARLGDAIESLAAVGVTPLGTVLNGTTPEAGDVRIRRRRGVRPGPSGAPEPPVRPGGAAPSPAAPTATEAGQVVRTTS